MSRVKTEEKSLAILDAAAKAFLAREFHDVLIDDVAAAAGTGKGTIYRYFTTKEELFFVSVLHGLDGLYETIARELAQEQSPRRRLAIIAAEVLRFAWNRRDLVTLLHRDERLFARRGAEFHDRRQKIVELVRQAIDEGIARGELRQIDSTTGAELFLGMLRGLNVFRRPADTMETIVVDVLDVFCNGIARRSDA
jgi:TetR/AcrR family fatty acid metabolism transcriptional regulator